MIKAWCVILLGFVMITNSTALHSELCKQKPKDKHCLIEWSVRKRWPHQVRYVYNWDTKQCFEIRWADFCQPPTGANNFPSEPDCQQGCSGWA